MLRDSQILSTPFTLCLFKFLSSFQKNVFNSLKIKLEKCASLFKNKAPTVLKKIYQPSIQPRNVDYNPNLCNTLVHTQVQHTDDKEFFMVHLVVKRAEQLLKYCTASNFYCISIWGKENSNSLTNFP